MSEVNNILVDLDCTLADYDQSALKEITNMLSPIEKEWLKTTDTTIEKLYYEVRPDWLEHRLHVISKQIGWWKSLEPIVSGFEIVCLAKSIGFTINVLTKASVRKPFSWAEKIEWCNEHMHMAEGITITDDKSSVYGKVLFDDWPEYIEAWLARRPRGLVIMPVRKVPSQANLNHPNIIRWDGTDISYIRIENALHRAFYRKMGENLDLSDI